MTLTRAVALEAAISQSDAKCRCPGGWCLNTPRADGWCGYCGDHCRKGSSHGGTR